MQSNCITIGCTKNGHGLNFTFDDFPFFWYMGCKRCPFCFLTWAPVIGIADSVDHNQQLADKEGINVLEPGEFCKNMECGMFLASLLFCTTELRDKFFLGKKENKANKAAMLRLMQPQQ